MQYIISYCLAQIREGYRMLVVNIAIYTGVQNISAFVKHTGFPHTRFQREELCQRCEYSSSTRNKCEWFYVQIHAGKIISKLKSSRSMIRWLVDVGNVPLHRDGAITHFPFLRTEYPTAHYISVLIQSCQKRIFLIVTMFTSCI